MRRRIIWAVFMALLFSIPVLALGMAGDQVAQGKAVFLKRCKMCHGADGQGNPAIARMLGVQFHPMDSEYIQKKTDEEIKTTIQKGKGKMAAIRGVSDQEIKDVIAYLRSLKKK